VEADVPECLAERAQRHSATELDRAVGDLSLVAFYYLLRIGEYTIKGNRNETKQTVQFKREDITFFKKNRRGQLRCLPRDAADDLIATADGATLKLDNKKTGGKGFASTKRQMGIDTIAQFGHWDADIYIFGCMGQVQQHFYQLIGWTGSVWM
jgi:hypothetical protein